MLCVLHTCDISFREDEGDLPFQKEGEFSRFFLKRVLLKTEGGQCVSLLANTYITIGQTRRFVRDDALTDPRLAGNQQLQELMTKELLELQVWHTVAQSWCLRVQPENGAVWQCTIGPQHSCSPVLQGSSTTNCCQTVLAVTRAWAL